MAHFYGTIKGNRGEASRLGTSSSGFRATACSWQGKVVVDLVHNEKTDVDMVTVSLQPHNGAGRSLLLYDDAVSGERSAFSAVEKHCLDFLTGLSSAEEKDGKTTLQIDSELYRKLRQFMISRSIGNH